MLEYDRVRYVLYGLKSNRSFIEVLCNMLDGTYISRHDESMRLIMTNEERNLECYSECVYVWCTESSFILRRIHFTSLHLT
jgi:hypothetical protein